MIAEPVPTSAGSAGSDGQGGHTVDSGVVDRVTGAEQPGELEHSGIVATGIGLRIADLAAHEGDGGSREHPVHRRAFLAQADDEYPRRHVARMGRVFLEKSRQERAVGAAGRKQSAQRPEDIGIEVGRFRGSSGGICVGDDQVYGPQIAARRVVQSLEQAGGQLPDGLHAGGVEVAAIDDVARLSAVRRKVGSAGADVGEARAVEDGGGEPHVTARERSEVVRHDEVGQPRGAGDDKAASLLVDSADQQQGRPHRRDPRHGRQETTLQQVLIPATAYHGAQWRVQPCSKPRSSACARSGRKATGMTLWSKSGNAPPAKAGLEEIAAGEVADAGREWNGARSGR